MTNKKKGEVEVELADGTYTMRFDFNALCTIEERTGKSIDELFFQGSISRLALREAMSVALKPRHPSMTSKKLGRLIQPSKLQEYIMAVFEGLAYANGQSEDQVQQMKDMMNEEVNAVIDAEVEEAEEGDAPLQLANGTTGTT